MWKYGRTDLSGCAEKTESIYGMDSYAAESFLNIHWFWFRKIGL